MKRRLKNKRGSVWSFLYLRVRDSNPRVSVSQASSPGPEIRVNTGLVPIPIQNLSKWTFNGD